MKLLYLTRRRTRHDDRFLVAFARHGIKAGLLVLEQGGGGGTPGSGVADLGTLGLSPGASTSDLDAAIPRFVAVVRSFAPLLIIAGPVHDGGYLAAKAGVACPWVLQSWAFDVLWENERDPAVAARAVQSLQAAPALFTDCIAVRQRCEAIAGRHFARHFVMPWGLEANSRPTRASRDSLRASLGLGDRLVFLHTRGLEPVYSVETLLTAFREVRAREPRACLLLASEGSLRPWVEAFVARSHLAKDVRILGALPHPRVLELFGAADVFVSCAASDGTSISLLEAMAAGLPIIVNDRGGNTEWIADEVNGWVVPYGDGACLMEAMSRAGAADAPRRLDMARINEDRVAARANWTANFPEYVGFLSGLAATRDAQKAQMTSGNSIRAVR